MSLNKRSPNSCYASISIQARSLLSSCFHSSRSLRLRAKDFDYAKFRSPLWPNVVRRTKVDRGPRVLPPKTSEATTPMVKTETTNRRRRGRKNSVNWRRFLSTVRSRMTNLRHLPPKWVSTVARSWAFSYAGEAVAYLRTKLVIPH